MAWDDTIGPAIIGPGTFIRVCFWRIRYFLSDKRTRDSGEIRSAMRTQKKLLQVGVAKR